jgi:hypothetical protein
VITIGIRAAPRVLTFAVYDSEENSVLNVEEIKIPAAFSRPEGLKYARSNLLDVLREYKVERAGIRITEPTAQRINIDRVELEGLIQEAFASSRLVAYYVGQISTISSKIGFPRTSFKRYVEGEVDYPIDNWQSMSIEKREAILTALGAVNA